MQQKELSTLGANGGTAPRMKMPFDISSMITKQDPLMVLNFNFVEHLFHLKTDTGIIDLYMRAGPPEIPLLSIKR